MISIENIREFVGKIPAGFDLVVYENGGDPMDGCVLYGFDEVGMFDSIFNVPAYAFLEIQ